MSLLRVTFLFLLIAATTVCAQPSFGPVRIDEGTRNLFYFPTIKTLNSGNMLCSWAAANAEWIGSYGREVDIHGVAQGATQFFDEQSPLEVTCPPRVEFHTLSSGAWVKMIYHE
jgi:hypothetical protein